MKFLIENWYIIVALLTGLTCVICTDYERRMKK